MNFQYFVSVVPTDVQTTAGFTYNTYQYSVKDQVRPIDHESGNHGVPGIYFKYDMSPLKVVVSQDREHLAQFLVRLCAGVGGLVATSKIVCHLVKSLVEMYCCRVQQQPKKAEEKQAAAEGLGTSDTAKLIPDTSQSANT